VNDLRSMLARMEGLAASPAWTMDELHEMAGLVLDLGVHELPPPARREHRAQTRRVEETYRRHLQASPRDARSLNNLAALLLSSGQVAEGHLWATKALAEAPEIRSVHENMMIADVYNARRPHHEIPAGVQDSPDFLVAYFDPQAH